MTRALLLIPLLLWSCSGYRLIVDVVPADDRLAETVVMQDGPGSGSKIALIDVDGLLMSGRRPGLITEGENPVAQFTEALQKAEQDRLVAAVLIRINSPGGTVTASDVMYRETMGFKQRTGKPVVVLMGEVAASGGYYLACAGDELIAHPTTITGSIGVIIQTINFSEGMHRIGIRADAITSGPNKDLGSPFSPMSDEHRAVLQGIVDDFYDGFLDIVVTRRPAIPESDLPRITDGRVLTGRHAAELGVVDRTGDLRTAFAAAKQQADLMGAKLVKYHRAVEPVRSPHATASLTTGAQVNLVQLNMDRAWLQEHPGFYYLWDPSLW